MSTFNNNVIGNKDVNILGNTTISQNLNLNSHLVLSNKTISIQNNTGLSGNVLMSTGSGIKWSIPYASIANDASNNVILGPTYSIFIS